MRRLLTSFLRASGLTLLLAALPGASCGPDPAPSPCELDRLGCKDPDPNDDFYLGSCPSEVEGSLDVEVGTGESAFEAFAAGTGPLVHFGPQGGQHVFMGFRVRNARLDVSPRLKLHFYLAQGVGCAPPESGSEIPVCEVTLGQRDLVLGGGGFALRTNPAGEVEESGLVVFVEVPEPTLPGLVALSVEDQCRRSGTDFQAWTRYDQ